MAYCIHPVLTQKPQKTKSNLPSIKWCWLVCLFWTSVNLFGQYQVQVGGTAIPVFQSPIDITLGPDELSVPLNIGFNFNFFGNTYSQFYISSNGFISFSNGGSGSNIQTLPDNTSPNNLIAIAWANVDPDNAEFTYETTGTAPYRKLHVHFYHDDNSDPPPCPSGYYLDAQIILYESTNIIELHTENWDGGNCAIPATQGIENAAGTTAFVSPGQNNSMWDTQNTRVTFIPDNYTDLDILQMEPVLCEGLQDIKILVQNIGQTTVDTFYSDWTWENVPQDAVPVYATLPPNSITEVVLGQKTISGGPGYPLKAWTYDPENDPDHYTPNDTISGTVRMGLSGDYTIGGTSPDYTTIGQAVSALITNGACDNVVFNIRSGTYTEELDFLFYSIAPGKKVIIQSESGNPLDVTITRNYTSGSTNRMIEINNASHLWFKDITLRVTGTVCATAVYMNSFCADIQFKGCRIFSPTCNSTSTSGAVVALLNGQKDDIVLDSNIIRKGSYGVYVSPGTSSLANDFVLTNNSIDSCFRAGAFLSRTNGLLVENNQIFSPSTSAYGIETNTNFGSSLLERNNIHISSGVYGLRIFRYNYNVQNAPDSMYLINNMINLGGTVSGSRTVNIDQSNQVMVWHNTVHSTSTNSASYAFYSSGNTGTDLRNNIITNMGTGRAAFLTTLSSDYNVYHNITPPLISNGTDYAQLLNWVLASGQDVHSIQVDPDYVSPTNLHVTHSALNGAGDELTPAVTVDFDLQTRVVSSPDIGADEFGFLSDDLALEDLYFSEALEEGPNEISTVVYNVGTNTVNSFTVQWRVNNTPQTPVIVNLPLLPGGRDTLTLGTLDLGPNQAFTFSANSHLPNGNPDNYITNDSVGLGPVYARLNGLYTVGGVSPDFPSLSSASSDSP